MRPRPIVLQSILGVVVIAIWLVGFIGLIMVDTGRLARYPWLDVYGVIAMFATMLSFLVAFVYTAMIGTMDLSRHKGDFPKARRSAK